MSGARIAIFNRNETRRDPRVRRIASTLAAAGHHVVVIEPARRHSPATEAMADFEIRRAELSRFHGRSEIRDFVLKCPEVAAVADAADPGILRMGRMEQFAVRFAGRLAIRSKLSPNRGSSDASRNLELGRLQADLLSGMALYAVAEEFRPHIAWSNDLDTLIPGYLLKKQLGAALVYDAHEIFSEQFEESSRSELWHSFYSRLEAALLPFTDGRLTVCDSLGDFFVRERNSGSFVTVRNCPERRFAQATKIGRHHPKIWTALYHGAYSPGRGLEEIIVAAAMLRNCRIVLRGFGSGEPALRRLANLKGVEDRVQFAVPVDVDEMIPSARNCDIGLSPFVPRCLNTRLSLPNKFFEYAAAGLALASSDLPEMAGLTREYNLGVIFEPGNPASIAETINGMLSHPEQVAEFRNAALDAARNRFNWEFEREVLFDSLNRWFGSEFRN